MKTQYPKDRKKPFSALITAALAVLIVLILMMAQQEQAAAKAKLSRTKVSLAQGKTLTLKLTGAKSKAKWSVAGAKVVTIKTRGKKKHKAVIKAKKKAGKCTIKVKVGKKLLKCRVTVKKKTGDTFREKPLSSSSRNLTSSFKRNQPNGLKADDEFITAFSNTSCEMLKLLNKDENRNILISPDSILTCMAMAEAGASGSTLAEIEKAFGGIDREKYAKCLYALNKRITGSKDISYNIADSIWYRENTIRVKDKFLQDNIDYFDSEIYEAPFNDVTTNDMNNWVYNHTLGMIPKIIDTLPPDARLTLINAIAFDGLWEEPYMETESGTFTTDGGEKQTASMLDGSENTYVELNGAGGFIKNYRGRDIAFMGFETPAGKTVDEFIQELDGADLAKAYRERVTTSADLTVRVTTRMPEFKYDYDSDLNDIMMSLGIKEAFTPAADFSDLSDDSIFIDRIIHKTHIELNKTGTKAAAATAIIAKANAIIDKKVLNKEVILDHPFVYALIDTESGLPLFIGAVKTVK